MHLLNFGEKTSSSIQNLFENDQKLEVKSEPLIIRDIIDNELTVVNSVTGNETKVYFSNSKIPMIEDFDPENALYQISDDNLIQLDLGTAISINSNEIIIISNLLPFEDIKSDLAKDLLEDTYFNLENEKDAIYSVEKEDTQKLYLTNIIEGGLFSIFKSLYPDFKIGDKLIKENGIYIKKQD